MVLESNANHTILHFILYIYINRSKDINIINQTIFDVQIESDLMFNRDKIVGRG